MNTYFMISIVLGIGALISFALAAVSGIREAAEKKAERRTPH